MVFGDDKCDYVEVPFANGCHSWQYRRNLSIEIDAPIKVDEYWESIWVRLTSPHPSGKYWHASVINDSSV